MRIFKILSGLALLNLVSVVIIANFTKPSHAESTQPTVLNPQISRPTPTPIIIVKKVVTKVYRTPTTALTPVNTNNTGNNSPATQTTPPPAPASAPQPQIASVLLQLTAAITMLPIFVLVILVEIFSIAEVI